MSEHRGETRLAAAALLRGEAIAGPHLVVAEGSEAGRRIPLGDTQTVGRGPGADVRLEDRGASRRHARLARVGDRWVVEDLGSKNGLRVNGRRCRRPRALRPGDEVTVGGTRLVLDAGLLDGAAPGEPPAGARPPIGPRRALAKTLPGAALLAAAALAALAALLLGWS